MTDREILRGLAEEVKELSQTPRMLLLQKEWKDHNALRGTRPMICVSPEGSWDEILSPKDLQCGDPLLREFEYKLRMKLYWGREIGDDTPISDAFNVPWVMHGGFYIAGLEEESKERVSAKGSFHYDKLIEDIDEDFHKLSFRKPRFDEAQSNRNLETAEELFGDILRVRRRGPFWWTMGITAEVIKLLGLEELMFAMYDNPQGLHRLMAWFRDEHLNFMKQCEPYLSLNNEDDLIASGGIGYTDELGTEGKPGYKDLWGFSESQETVGISPEMFGEFIFPYQKPILEHFGINCYGCCEPVEGRWKWISTVPRLRRISVSPWSNKFEMRDILGKNYIYSRKPNPSYICKGFDEEPIRKELTETLSMAKDIHLEIILKDTHTVENHPERFARWVKIARETAESC